MSHGMLWRGKFIQMLISTPRHGKSVGECRKLPCVLSLWYILPRCQQLSLCNMEYQG
jgi:hypothetical protein